MDAMQAIGTELLKAPRGDLKFIFNHKGIVFFRAAQQHRDVKINGLSYEHDYRGNAVAGLVMKDRLEVRFHKVFSDERVRNIWSDVLKFPEIAQAGLGPLYYQGRLIL